MARHAWLARRSALGDLLDSNFEALNLSRRYRQYRLPALWGTRYKHHEALQNPLFDPAQSSFGFSETATLYGPGGCRAWVNPGTAPSPTPSRRPTSRISGLSC